MQASDLEPLITGTVYETDDVQHLVHCKLTAGGTVFDGQSLPASAETFDLEKAKAAALTHAKSCALMSLSAMATFQAAEDERKVIADREAQGAAKRLELQQAAALLREEAGLA